MPLRPAINTIHPRGPQPAHLRRVSCPACGKSFEVSQRAVSVRCPACTSPLEFNDLVLRTRLEGDVSTMGHVALAEPSEMLGRLVCGQFTNAGRFEGRAVVYGQVVLTRESLTTGQLSGRSLRIDHGATTHIKAEIRPNPPAKVAGKTSSPTPIGRLIQRPARRLIRPLA